MDQFALLFSCGHFLKKWNFINEVLPKRDIVVGNEFLYVTFSFLGLVTLIRMKWIGFPGYV